MTFRLVEWIDEAAHRWVRPYWVFRLLFGRLCDYRESVYGGGD